MKLRNSRIVRNLALCLLCLLLPVILLNIAGNVYNLVTLRREVMNSSRTLFTTLAKELEGSLTNVQTNGYALSSDVGLKALNVPGEMTPARILDYREQILNLGYVARSGSLDMEINCYLLDSGKAISSDGTMDRLGETDFDRIKEAGLSGIWELTQDKNNASFLSYRYFLPSALEGMIISMDISASSVETILEAVRIGGSGDSFLILNNGSAVLGETLGSVPDFSQESFPKDGEISVSGPDEEGNLLMFQPICGGMLTLGFCFSEDAILGNARATMGVSVAVILVSAVLGLILVFMSYRVLVKPIRTLVGAMKNVGDNNLNIEIPLNTQDEIGFMYAQFNAMVAKLQSLINEVYLQKIGNQELRISMYQAQINPHFLHNCLNFMNQSALASGDEYTAQMARFLSRYFRYSIASEDLTTKVADEMNVVTAYMEIQKIRFPGRVDYLVNMDPGAEEIRIPKLSVQPLVENCFVHGLNQMRGPLFLSIDILRGDKTLSISVRDNSGLMTPEKIREMRERLSGSENSASLGLANINNRVRSMYGENSGLKLELTETNGLEATIRIDLGRDTVESSDCG